MKRGLNICCGVLALALLFGCAQSVPQQEQEPKAEPVAAGAFAAEVEPEYLQHAAYMSAPKGFFGPDQPLRRAEAAQLVCNLAALSPKNLPESGFAAFWLIAQSDSLMSPSTVTLFSVLTA